MRIEIIDIVIAVLILYSIFRGYHLGLIRQIGALGGILLAILGANLLSPFMGLLLNKTELFPEYVNHKIAYLVTFLIILFSCKFITRLMHALPGCCISDFRINGRCSFLRIQIYPCNQCSSEYL